MPRYAAGYIRVSSEEQAQHGISVEAQREILKAWAIVQQAGDLVLYEDPGFSGKNTDRPALRQLLADVRAGTVAALVVWKLDRLSRSLRDTLSIIEDELQPMGVALHSVTESIDTSTPAGRMMLNILASFAQLEREQDSDRVVMAHKHLARDCRYLGGHIALGYRVDEDRRFALDPVTAPIVRRVFEMYLARTGYSQILEYLNTEAAQFCRRRTPWGKSDLNYLLKNEIYAGVYTRRIGQDGRSKVSSPEVIRIPGGVPAIVTPEEWARVCALRAANRTQSAAYRARTVYPLSGLVRCGVCGALMPLEHGGKARDGSVERYYTCRRHCVRPARLEAIEAAAAASVAALAAQPEIIRTACAVANEYAAAATEDNLAAAAPVRADLARVRREEAKITAFIADQGADAPRTLAAQLRRLEAEELTLQARLDALLRPVTTYDPDLTVSALTACQSIQKKPPEEQKSLLQRALTAIRVTDQEFQIVLAWHTYGGDDPPAYICHASARASRTRTASVPSLSVIPLPRPFPPPAAPPAPAATP